MTMRMKISDESRPLVLQTDAVALHQDMMADIPDFTPGQWAWLKAKTLELEKDYVPTRSLATGL